MSRSRSSNLAASVRQRLLNLSRDRGESFQRTLDRFALERFLYRLGLSPERERFVLKGAFALDVWSPAPSRPTRDADFGTSNQMTADELVPALRSICDMPVGQDAITFDPESVRVEEIRRERTHGGLRASLRAELARALSTVRLDFGFGDVVVPEPVNLEIPTLLDLPSPRVRVYPLEPMIAEKLEAIVVLGFTNTRMKDFYDLAALAETMAFEGDRVARAIRATFARRETPVPKEPPLGLREEFLEDSVKEQQWQSFLRNTRLSEERPLAEIGQVVNDFLMPVARAVAAQEPFSARWPAGGPWRAETS